MALTAFTTAETSAPIGKLIISNGDGVGFTLTDPGTYTITGQHPWYYHTSDAQAISAMTAVAAGTALTVTVAAGTPVSYYTKTNQAGANNQYDLTIKFAPVLPSAPGPIGATTPSTGAFTSLSTTGAATVGATLGVTGLITASGGATVAGALTHTGTTIGFLGATPAVQQALTVRTEKVQEIFGLKAVGGPHNRSPWYIAAGVDLNSVNTDVAIFTGLPAKYRVSTFRAFDASTNLTTATVAAFTAAAAGGTSVMTTTGLTALTAATKWKTLAVDGASLTDYYTASSIYLRCTGAQGAPATATFMMQIEDLTP